MGSLSARPYLGARAAVAVQLLNASWDGPPIEPTGDGYWLAPRRPAPFDALVNAPTHLRFDDTAVIGLAIDMGGILVIDDSTISDLHGLDLAR